MFWKFTAKYYDWNHEKQIDTGIVHTADNKWGLAADELAHYYGDELISISFESFAPGGVLVGFSDEELARVEEKVFW